MAVLSIDLGGTKVSIAMFSEEGDILSKQTQPLNNRQGQEVGQLIITEIKKYLEFQNASEIKIRSIGIAVPGISRKKTGTVWAPNIPAWDDYPLLKEVQELSKDIPLIIESDRSCYISGELWKGNAIGCKDAIYLAIGTGIGAGILVNGKIIRGADDISGAIGWMALDRPFDNKYVSCGCFEYHASGEGIAKVARELLQRGSSYNGILRNKKPSEITSSDVFDAYDRMDDIAAAVLKNCIEFWGMAIANLVSLFNPEKIILGGGVFGPAVKFIPAIQNEASRWAQPISMKQVSLESSKLGSDAGLYGAAFLALQQSNPDPY